ncbi:hypothetical protein [Herbaspirillum rhizosphaerae]|uniref:hypothetical protein n=1 Tax=Herbaspirillum rhizosphaerae TaxID=346179 RepID=UPI0012ED72B7|nr:hypothetical protein [Herbaspirillum rhizosphaerae]
MLTTEDENHDAEGECPWRGEASQSGSSAWSQPVMRCEKWIKKEKLSERSEFFSFPFFASQHRAPRRGWIPRSPSFAYFSWRDKKSERLPGRPRQRLIEERTTSITYTGKSEQNNERRWILTFVRTTEK